MSKKNSSTAKQAGPSMMPGVISGLNRALELGRDALLSRQQPDGHWVYELEADATIPAEYILLGHFLGVLEQPLYERMAVYLRNIQEEHGGWPLFHRGDFNISASVKAYYALKCVGDDINAPHMVRAREAILNYGGAEKSNVFTRIQLALFGAVPWRAAPVMPVEIMLLPKWFPFHLNKVAYWSRTVIVPLLVVMAMKPQAKNPNNIRINELFCTPPDQVKNWHSNDTKSLLNPCFRYLDAALRFFEPYIPQGLRTKAIEKCVNWVAERLNGEDGLGAIYPAMANSVMMYHCLGFSWQDLPYETARRSVKKLVVDTPERSYCQPCLSPVWDTGLALHALLDSGVTGEALGKACDWLISKQVLEQIGDWAFWRPNVRPGGWAFQYENPHYPDVDDTAVVVMALDRVDRNKYREAIDRAVEWVLGLQSKNGGWGAFDADNTYYYLNHIPFADHGALLDPPSADVTARCLGMLAQLGYKNDHPKVAHAIDYLRGEQEPEGCWYGRWGTNYIYGTWSVLCALNAAGIGAQDPMIRRAVDWLLSKQKEDGGWGEDGASYYAGKPKGENVVSTPSQTAWALLGLMAAGEVDNPAVAKGIEYLTATQNDKGEWKEDYYTAVGFPKVFYLRYHGYKAFFPQWALGRYNSLKQGNSTQVIYGL